MYLLIFSIILTKYFEPLTWYFHTKHFHSYVIGRNPHRRCSIKECALENFAKLTGKYLCWSFFFNKNSGLGSVILLKKRLWHTLREKCPNTNFLMLRIQSEYRKIQTRRNFEHFSRKGQVFSCELCETPVNLLEIVR